jgi:hypothetical protein
MMQSFIGSVIGHKQMVVVKGRYRIHTYPGFRQSAGDCCQKAYRIKRGMNGQRNQARCKLIRQSCAFGLLAPHDECRSFSFTEYVHRPDGGWNFLVFRDAAKNENTFVHFGLHILRQRLQIAFARHRGAPFQHNLRYGSFCSLWAPFFDRGKQAASVQIITTSRRLWAGGQQCCASRNVLQCTGLTGLTKGSLGADPKLTFGCALISLAELIDDLACC